MCIFLNFFEFGGIYIEEQWLLVRMSLNKWLAVSDYWKDDGYDRKSVLHMTLKK